MLTGAIARFVARRGAMLGGAVLLAVLALSLLAPAIAPQDPANPLDFNPDDANHPPALSWPLLLGADGRGRSVLALLLWGGRVSLAIGVGAALLAALVGVLLGGLACWRRGLFDPLLSRLMDIGAAAPPLLVLLILSSRLGGVPAPVIALVFAATGWIAPARLTRAAVMAAQSAPYVEAARAVGVGGPRLAAAYLLPGALAPVAAWTASGAAVYVALEAGLDFLGLGLPDTTTSWGTMLVGAQDAVAAGNWWWMAFGGLALALTTLALGATARGIAVALDPFASGALPALSSSAHTARIAPTGLRAMTDGRNPGALGGGTAVDDAEAMEDGASVAALAAAWQAWQRADVTGVERALPPWRRAHVRAGVLLLAAVAIIGATVGAATARSSRGDNAPTALALLRRAAAYPARTGQNAAYIATASYAAAADALRGRQLPWAAWGACPDPLRGPRCARSTAVQILFSGGRGRVAAEGIRAVCGPGLTWDLNPMAGLAQTQRRSCGPLGANLDGLGATSALIESLLPSLDTAPSGARIVGTDAVAGRACWLILVGDSGRACLDIATGLALSVEWLDRAGQPMAVFEVTGIQYGLYLAPTFFENPIPDGHGPLLDPLTQALPTIQAADSLALFYVLYPAYIPPGLSPRTATFDSFIDDTRGYATQQRVRQTYVDRSGRVALALIETLAGSAWDDTPPRARARQVTVGGHTALVWSGRAGAPTVVRAEFTGTALLVSSRTLPLSMLERVVAGLEGLP